MKQTMLLIMDGYGLNDDDYGNAIKKANTPNLDKIFKEYPGIKLEASGKYVGLPDEQMGNSEVGHLNIGAGRVIYQDLTRITKEIEEGNFFTNSKFLDAVSHVKKNGSKLHIFGLLSDGGVHSHIEHIKALIKLAKDNDLEKVYLHAFMDGRDTNPTSGYSYMEDVINYMNIIGCGEIGVISGRYYAMDRDKRWDRVEKAYDCLLTKTDKLINPLDYIKESYNNNVTDEFIVPVMCSNNGNIEDKDAIIFANFRPDRAREITRALTEKEFDGFNRKRVLNDIKYICMTEYDSTLTNVDVAYRKEEVVNTLGAYISSLGLKQLRIAETEKYAHVTFFFNGGVEEEGKNEDRILIPSPKVSTYDLQPEMSAYEITERVIKEIKEEKYSLIVLNFANSDMVGHTGNFDAAVKAIETLDKCVSKIVEVMLKVDGQIFLTADHGNSDVMLDSEGNSVTAHSTNPVPFVYISNSNRNFKKEVGKLSDIAPSILNVMGLDIPKEMTGEILI